MSKRDYTPESVTRAKAAEMAQAKAEQSELKLQPGPFPIDALNETQRRICEAVASVHQLPIELAAMPALAVTAAALGKSCKLTGAVNGQANFANLYITPAAPKSTGKGAAAQLAEPIIQASAKLVEIWNTNVRPRLETNRQIWEARTKHLTNCLVRRKDGKRSLSDGELAALESDLRRVNEELNRIRPLLAASPSYHVGNATSEALAIKFARNDDTLFALAYEGGDTLRVMLGKYAKGDKADCDLWLSGYSVEPYQSDRVLRGNVSIIPCLSALIFCQPSLLRELYSNEEAFERGLTARILPFICESSLCEDDGMQRIVPVNYRLAWHNLIAGLLAKRGELSGVNGTALIQCSADAREIFRAYHNESIILRNGELRDIQGELGRWRENACRIGLGLCVADNPAATTLTGEQAQRAVKVARWAQLSALQVMHTGRMERRMTRLSRLSDLVHEAGGELTLRNLEKSHGFCPEEVERLAAESPTRLCLETKQNPNGGPLSRILRLAHL